MNLYTTHTHRRCKEQEIFRPALVLGIAWVGAMSISLLVYAVQVMSKDSDSPPPEFFMDKVNDNIFPFAYILVGLLVLQLYPGKHLLYKLH